LRNETRIAVAGSIFDSVIPSIVKNVSGDLIYSKIGGIPYVDCCPITTAAAIAVEMVVLHGGAALHEQIDRRAGISSGEHRAVQGVAQHLVVAALVQPEAIRATVMDRIALKLIGTAVLHLNPGTAALINQIVAQHIIIAATHPTPDKGNPMFRNGVNVVSRYRVRAGFVQNDPVLAVMDGVIGDE